MLIYRNRNDGRNDIMFLIIFVRFPLSYKHQICFYAPKLPKTKSPVIQLGRKTAFLSALSISIFFVLVQLVILVYSFYMGENVGERLSARISQSEHAIEPMNLFFERVILFLVNTFLLYLFFRIEFWILTHFPHNREKAWFSVFVLFLFVGGISTMISQLLGIWFKGRLTAYQYSIILFVKDLILFITSVFVTNLIYLIIKNQERIEENKNLAIENFKNRYNALKIRPILIPFQLAQFSERFDRL